MVMIMIDKLFGANLGDVFKMPGFIAVQNSLLPL